MKFGLSSNSRYKVFTGRKKLCVLCCARLVQLEFGSHERNAESYCQESSELDTER